MNARRMLASNSEQVQTGLKVIAVDHSEFGLPYLTVYAPFEKRLLELAPVAGSTWLAMLSLEDPATWGRGAAVAGYSPGMTTRLLQQSHTESVEACR